jgi:hypothetical protein
VSAFRWTLRPRLWTLAIACAVALSQSACTLIGLGIGAAIPKRSSDDVDALEPGSDVRLELQSGGHVDGTFALRAGSGFLVRDAIVTGAPVREGLAAQPDPRVISRVSNDSDDVIVPRDLIRDANARDGSYWFSGLVIGLLLDVTALVVFSQANSHSFSFAH